ncbi:probable G protein-coupled receptor 85 [Parasteatoda tepidariorum]|uniref:probable G protein-coupled receptor 85 n=1 Tax=Parasteatoda tepidariorum TaxID=114398 RepID=UPI00077F8928
MNVFTAQNNTSFLLPTPSSAVTLFQFISLGLIIALGSASNSLVIYAFCRYLQIRRRTPHTYMLTFVSVDLVRVLFCFPLLFVSVVHPLQVTYGNQLCQVISFINIFSLVGNSLCIFAMTIDRYLDNKHRAFYRRNCRSFFGTAILIIFINIAFILAFPAVYSNKHSPLNSVEVSCTFPSHYITRDVNAYPAISSVSFVFCVTNLLYLKLFFLLRDRRKMRPVIYEPAVSENWGFFDPRIGIPVRNRWLADSISQPPVAVLSRNVFHSHPIPTNYDIALWRSKKQKDNEKLTKVCFVIHVLFSALWLPYYATLFYMVVRGENIHVSYGIEIFVTWLTYIQAIITPFIFFSMSGLKRRKFRMLNGKRLSPTLSSTSS